MVYPEDQRVKGEIIDADVDAICVGGERLEGSGGKDLIT